MKNILQKKSIIPLLIAFFMASTINIKVTKELNNILCYLCLYNKDLANYIKQKGGLANILEELKINIDSNDNNSQFMKLSSLKMLIK